MPISVIVPAYNEEKYLRKTLESIQRAKEFLCERSGESTEIIVVDNASTDATADDESLYMGEDVDFYWRLSKFAKRQNGHTCFIDDIQVVPSTRRFDQWSFWRTLFFTNPLIVLTFRRRPSAWRDWYRTITR